MRFGVSFSPIPTLRQAAIDAAMEKIAAEGIAIMDPMIHETAVKPHQNIHRDISWGDDGVTVTWDITPPRPHPIFPTAEHRARVAPRPAYLKFFWASAGPAGQAWGGHDSIVFFRHVYWKPRYAPRAKLYEHVPLRARTMLAPVLHRIGIDVETEIFGV